MIVPRTPERRTPPFFNNHGILIFSILPSEMRHKSVYFHSCGVALQVRIELSLHVDLFFDFQTSMHIYYLEVSSSISSTWV